MPRLNTIRADGRVFDPEGRCVARLSRRQLAELRVQAREDRLSGMGDFSPSDSVGASLFELFHPSSVQDEYRAVGKPAPSVAEIVAGAADSAAMHAGQGIRDTAGNLL